MREIRQWQAALAAVLTLVGLAAAAQTPAQQPSTPSDSARRPIYLEVEPVAHAGYSILPADVVAAMAREAISGAQQAVIRLENQNLPANVRVLRILYLVHQQPTENGMVLAASASTELLRTRDHGDGVNQTYSVYQGMQQTLVQGQTMQAARQQLSAEFKQALQTRVREALSHSSH